MLSRFFGVPFGQIIWLCRFLQSVGGPALLDVLHRRTQDGRVQVEQQHACVGRQQRRIFGVEFAVATAQRNNGHCITTAIVVATTIGRLMRTVVEQRKHKNNRADTILHTTDQNG